MTAVEDSQGLFQLMTDADEASFSGCTCESCRKSQADDNRTPEVLVALLRVLPIAGIEIIVKSLCKKIAILEVQQEVEREQMQLEYQLLNAKNVELTLEIDRLQAEYNELVSKVMNEPAMRYSELVLEPISHVTEQKT
jgi:hypothetical protein